MYKIIDNGFVRRLRDGACVPVDDKNKDYQEYLDWVREGNTAEAADPPPPPDTRRAEIVEALDEIIDDILMPPRLRKLCRALKRILV